MKKKKSKTTRIIIAALILTLVACIVVTVKRGSDTYNERRAAEQFEEPDFNSMQQFCGDNAAAVMDALKSNNSGKLKKLMIDPTGIENITGFTDWSQMDMDSVVSMGAGSLTAAPDENGQMDISERFFVNCGDVKYVLFIETLTSRWGLENEGVSAIGVTTFAHFDGVDYTWNGEDDDQSALAGQLFWNKDQGE